MTSIKTLSKLFALLLVVTTLQLAAQQYTPTNPIPPTPNATAIQKYGNTDVSLYTGAVNVGIPIFTATDQGIGLPVSLNYSGSGGINVQEIASWVGLGWTLNAGGAVSRTIQNRADDDHMKGFGFTKRTSLPDPVTANQLELAEFANGDKDAEPDIFYYNVNGISGKFVIKYGGEVFQIPKTENKIVPYSGSAGNYSAYNGLARITAFKIIDTKGTTYWFEAIEESRSRPMGNTWTDTGFYTSSWYLTKIVNSNETAEITLNYTPFTSFQYPQSVNNIYNLEAGGFQETYTKTESHSQRLSSITFPQGSVHFIATSERCDLANDKYLEKIEIRDKNNSLVKRFDFDYSYFDTNGTAAITPCDGNVHVPGNPNNSDGNHHQRLKLDQVQEVGSDGLTTKPPYKFTYNTSHYLPSRYSFSRDHWGFYNGASNTSLEPEYTVRYKRFADLTTGTFGSANRNASEAHMKAGILTEIEYPTGGKTVFDYEAHEAEAAEANFYEVVNSTNHSVGLTSEQTYSSAFTVSANFNLDTEMLLQPSWIPSSSCKLQIKIRDVSTNQVVKSTTYDSNVTPFSLPAGQYQLWFDLLGDPVYCGGFGGDIFVSMNWQNRTYTKNLDVGGLRIKNIKNYTDNGVTLATEKTFEYTHENESSGTLITIPNYGFYMIGYASNMPPTVLGWARTSQSNVPLATTKGSHVGYSTVTEYLGTATDNKGKTVYTFSSPKTYPDQNVGWNYNYGDGYFHFLGESHPTWVFPKTNSQDWRRGLLLKREDFRKDVGNTYTKVRETENVYEFLTPSDLPFTNMNPTANNTTANDYVTGLVTDASFGPDVVYFKYYNYYSGRNHRKSEILRKYNETGTDVLTTTTDYFYENTDHRQVTKTVMTDSEGQSQESRFKYPHDYISPSTAITKLKDRNQIAKVIERHTLVDGKVTQASGMRFTYDMGNDNLLLSNAYRYETVTPSTFLPSSTDGDSFTDYALDYTLTYDADGRLTSVTGKNGVTTSYLWDADDLLIVKGEGISYADLLTAYTASQTSNFEADIRNHVLTASAFITTYAYELLKGIKTITDTENKKQTFEYDPLGRMKQVFDYEGNPIREITYHLNNN